MSRKSVRPLPAAVPAAAFDLATFIQELSLRPKPLIQTLWGDSIVPHGGVASLSSLVRLAEAFDINERLTRISMFRLAKEEWFQSVRVGRLSFYRMSDEQVARFQDFQPKVYEPLAQAWDGSWHLVLVSGEAIDEELRRELGWLGLGQLAPDLLICPGDRLSRLVHVLRYSERLANVQILEAHALSALPTLYPELIRRAWKLDALAAAYGEFIERFRPALAWVVKSAESTSPRDAFSLRTLLAHEWRRLALRDPKLPAPLMPPDWPGQAAFQLTRTLYQRLLGPSEHYLASILETPEGPVTAPAFAALPRFGGLTWPSAGADGGAGQSATELHVSQDMM